MTPAPRGPITDADRRLRAAREAAYGPHATADGMRRLRAIESSPGRRPARRAPIAALVVGAVLAGAIGGWAAGFATAASARPAGATPSASAPTDDDAADALALRVATSDGRWSADDFYRRFPDELPDAWRTDVAAHSFLRLGGGVRLTLRPADTTSALLVVPTCPSADAMFDWSLLAPDGTQLGGATGRCGRVAGTEVAVPPGSAELTLAIATAGAADYAVAVFER